MQDDEYTNYYASLMQQMQQAGSSPASSEDSGEKRNGSSGGSPASSDDLEKQYHHHHTGLSPAESSNGDYLYEAMGTHNVSYDADDDSEEEEEMIELPHHRLMISSPTVAAVATTAKKRKTRAKRDPNKPKGFLPAILLYSNANRPRVKEENPTATFGEVVSILNYSMLRHLFCYAYCMQL